MVAESFKMPVSFDQFVEWLPESTETGYELHNGSIVEMPKPRGQHSKVAGFVIKQLNQAIDAAQRPYFIPRECLVRSLDRESAYEPDIAVLDEPALVDEPYWEMGSILTQGRSIKLIVEVISTNWRDDYLRKQADYEALGIQEYWLIDCIALGAALGGRRFIGNPKQPTVTVCTLVDGEYETQLVRSGRLGSTLFPDLALTAEQILTAGQALN
ncbi:MAG: Uma2 family endonuclease [Elainella sp.]